MRPRSPWVRRTLALLFATVGILSSLQSFAQNPRSRMTVVGPALPLHSLKELWSKTPVVVLATAFEATPGQIHGHDAVKLQFFEVEEVLKDSEGVLKGRRIRVRHLGGSALASGEEIVTDAPDDARPLPQGDQAVLFLAPAGNVFVIPFGQAGTYVVSDKTEETITISRRARQFPEWSGRQIIPKAALLQLLRGLKTSR